MAQEATAESNQTSKMSLTRCIVPPQVQGIVIWSTYGRCGSGTGTPPASSSSWIVPITRRVLQEVHCQTGIGIPQYRCREMHQSRASPTQSANRALPAQSGYQVTCLISSSICSFTFTIFRNHCSVARKMIGVLHRQQWPYRWTTSCSASR